MTRGDNLQLQHRQRRTQRAEYLTKRLAKSLAACLAGLLSCAVVAPAAELELEAPEAEAAPELHLPPPIEQAAIDAAVLSGLRYLASVQGSNGRFGNGIAVTAIAGMAFLSGGHTPSRGAYRGACRNALEAILENQDPVTGYLGANSFGNYYDHGFATLFLAECYGMSPDPRVADALQAAIEHIHQAQNHEGGWRYQPNPRQADMSVTVSQIMALRAAYNVGIGGVDSQRCMERALGFVRACFRPDGSFAYLANSRSRQGPSAVPLTASGAMSLIGAGITSEEHALLGPSLAFLRQHYPAHLLGQGMYHWYGQYYTAQALFHSPRRADWQEYWRRASYQLLREQSDTGAWETHMGHGASASYCTGMALIILQIPNNYLPIFQR